MSVFKRRGGGAAAASSAAKGVRAAPFGAPVPLMSTGIASLDDILCGGGVLSGSVVMYLPFAQASGSIAQIGAPAETGADTLAISAAEAYTELCSLYATAQGVVSGHVVVVIGEAPDNYLCNMMGPAADERDEKASLSSEASINASEASSNSSGSVPNQPTGADSDAPADTTERLERMRIAWRYEKAKREPTMSEGDRKELDAFCTTFDLSKRTSERVIERARAEERLFTQDISSGGLDAAWRAVERGVQHCEKLAASGMMCVSSGCES